jgi:hypothetical protein
MATTLSPNPINSTFSGAVAGGYIRAAFLSNESLSAVTFKENIEYKQVVRKLVDNITFEAPTCDFTPLGTVALSERILTLEKFQIHRQLCKNDFLKDWESSSEQNGQLHASLTDAIIANVLAGMAARNEVLIWQGVNATAGQYDGFETLFNAGGSGVLTVATPEAITSANVIEEMGRLVLTLPTRVRRATEKPIIAVSSNVAEAYRTAILGLGGGFYLYQGEAVVMNWQGQYDVVECPGMSDDTMAFYQKSNLWFGTNTLDQWNNVAVLDMFEHDLSNNVRFAASFFAGVQFGFGDEIAFYQYTA